MFLYEEKKSFVRSELDKLHYIKISYTSAGFMCNNKRNTSYKRRTSLTLDARDWRDVPMSRLLLGDLPTGSTWEGGVGASPKPR
jgi:hypothetical protein